MILNSLELINFKKYTNKSFSFDEGLVGIIGKNGSGKSTIFEAILFALYGELKNKGSKELIKNSKANDKEPLSVSLVFEFDDNTYRVIREFRGKALTANANLYKNEECVASGAKDVTNWIEKLVKMGKNAFMHTLFASQKELTSLSNLKPEERKKMIRRLLGLEKIDTIENMLIDKSRELKRDINSFTEVLLKSDEIEQKESFIVEYNEKKRLINENQTLKSNELETLRLKEIDAKKALDLLQSTKEQRVKLLNELELIKNSLESNKTQQIKLSIQLQELEQKQKELATLEGIKNEFEQLQPQLLEQQKLKEIELKKDGLNKEQIQLRAQYKKVQETIASLEAGVKNFNNLQAKHQQIKNEIEKLQTSIKELENQIKTINSSISGEQKVIDISKSQIAQIQKIGKGSNCPTCTRPLLEEYDRVIDNLSSTVLLIQKEKIDKLNLELSKFENSKGVSERQKEELNKQVQELSKEIAVIETKQKDLLAANTHCKEVKDKGIENKNELEKLLEFTYDENYHKNLVQKEQILRPKYESYKTLQTIIQRVPSVQKELDEIVKAVQEQSRAFANKELDIKAVVYDETNHKVKIEEFTSLQKQKDELLSAINNLKVQIAQIDGEVKTIQTALDANKKHQEKLLKKQQDLMDYEKIKLSLSEFKTKLNSKIAPRISQIASHMYSQITKGKYQHIEADNDFDFYIYDDGKRFPIERFSGGEIDLANLVLRIAISKTLGELNGSANIGFLAFDEIFGSQDDSRRMEILEAFHTIKEQYRQIFLISHEMEIKEMFERVVEV